MKIVTWNCSGKFREKFEHLNTLDADLLIIQECENPPSTKHKKYIDWAKNYLWIGDSENKGVGVFARDEIILERKEWSNRYKDHIVKYFLPCTVSTMNEEFDLLAVWTHLNNSPNFGYMGQFWKYLQTNKENFKRVIIAGDFNSNAIWDQWDRWWNHSDVVKELKELGIESLYHLYTKDEQGKEVKPTFFHRSLKKPYHIDYCFSSTVFFKRLAYVEVGNLEKWRHLSDHSPVTISFTKEQ